MDDQMTATAHAPAVEEAIRQGSGFTRDQLNGAAAMLNWLEHQGALAEVRGERAGAEPWPGHFSPDDERDGGHSER